MPELHIDWTKVIVTPYGLAGFALFLVFLFVARVKRRDERRWVVPTFIGMAIIALIGGLSLGYVRERNASIAENKTGQTTQQQQNNQVQQTSSGASSPNVQGVQGPVNINIDQNSNNSAQNAPKSKPEKKENNNEKK
jgi:negative regulator of sigma E activity